MKVNFLKIGKGNIILAITTEVVPAAFRFIKVKATEAAKRERFAYGVEQERHGIEKVTIVKEALESRIGQDMAKEQKDRLLYSLVAG